MPGRGHVQKANRGDRRKSATGKRQRDFPEIPINKKEETNNEKETT